MDALLPAYVTKYACGALFIVEHSVIRRRWECTLRSFAFPYIPLV